MKALQRLACSFALAASTSAAAEPPVLPPGAAPAITVMTASDRGFLCNATYVGPGVSITTPHCFDEVEAPFTLYDRDGQSRPTRHAYIPGEDDPAQRDRDADPALTSDLLHRSVGRDKAIFYDPAGGMTNSIMPIAPLDALVWRTPTPDAQHQVADVSIIGYWPSANDDDNHTLRRYPCRLFRLTNINEMLVHNCPEVPGVSGSPIVTENAPGDYSIVALHHGAISTSNIIFSDPMGMAIQAALPGPKVGLATGVWSLRTACDTLPCTVQYNARGHASFRFAP